MKYSAMEILKYLFNKLDSLESMLIDNQIKSGDAEDIIWDNDPVDIFKIEWGSALYDVVRDIQHEFINKHKI
jgi:hypothetical protein